MEKTKRKMKRWQKILIGILVVILILGIAAYFFIRNMFSQPDIEAAQGTDKAIVQTEKGKIRGSIEDDIYQYLGIPYAVANERFTRAEAVKSWDGVFEATKVGAMSPQSGMLGMSARNQEGTDNNCQNLNIWTPGIQDGKKRAVMVWLHGGGFSTGTANSELYNGEDLSKAGNVVVVSVNHRLGVSGFLDLSDYGDKYHYSANAGLDDIVKALEWIQDNIEEFGGDPDNVALFGQSGGGAKVLALMTSPYAKGLFERGIVQSGATETMGVTFSSKEASHALTEHILEKLNITSENIEDIQNVSMDELQKASEDALQETAEEFQIPAPLTDGYAMEWGPVVDGDYLPENPVTAKSFAENGKDIELLIGSNLNEWTTMMGQDQGDMTEEEVKAYESAYPDKDSDNAKKVDTLIRIPMLKIMSHKAAQGGANVYAYVFTWENGSNAGRGVNHGAEIPYVFDHRQDNEDAQKFADQVSQAWINFAKTGVPSADGLPEWEPYDNEKGATMILDKKSNLRYGHDRELMKLLKDYSVDGDLAEGGKFSMDSRVNDVINDEVFADYGRLIFPVDVKIDSGLMLQDVNDILPWYSEINPKRTVEIVNYMEKKAASGEQIFYNIYSKEEQQADPDKKDTGLFFFRGNPGEKTAILNAGGGFVYVAGIHDSFPQALELSKKGYNAFALIYRPGAQTACEDLARAIAFLQDNADKLQIDMTGYSLWGGSAGARMAAWVGSYGTAYFGERSYPQPGAVIMQYTGLTDVTGEEPPTYACVGTRDGIASYRSMQYYIRQIKSNGTDAQIEVFDGLSHGFGLGEGTVAEGWIDRAVDFWESNV